MTTSNNRLKMAMLAALEAQAGGAKSSGGNAKPPMAETKNLPTVGGIDFAEDAGKGMENVDKDSKAIPFLIILQPQSPIVLDEKVAGAKAGMIANSVTGELYGEEAFIIPCAFQRRFIRWAPRDAGGGFRGEFTPGEVQDMRTKGLVKELDNRLYFPLDDGTVHEKKSDKCVDTRSHFVLVMRKLDDPFAQPMILAMSSTGIKTSKQFIARIDGIKLQRDGGGVYTPPSFSHIYRMTSLKKTNDEGTWWLPVIDMAAQVKVADIYNLAKGFHQQVSAGAVTAAHDSVRGAGHEDDSSAKQQGF